jgi:hypothetical protein
MPPHHKEKLDKNKKSLRGFGNVNGLLTFARHSITS